MMDMRMNWTATALGASVREAVFSSTKSPNTPSLLEFELMLSELNWVVVRRGTN